MKLGLVMPLSTVVQAAALNTIIDVVMEAYECVVRSESPKFLTRAFFCRGQQPQARTVLGKAVVKDGAEWILWLDDDMIIPPGTIKQMIQTVQDRPEIKMLSGLYFSRSHSDLHGDGDYPPCAFTWGPKGHVPFDTSSHQGIHEVSAVGFGILLMHKDVFEDVVNVSKGLPFITTPNMTEDVHFCNMATVAGHKMYLDSSIVCGHLKLVAMDSNNIPLKELADVRGDSPGGAEEAVPASAVDGAQGEA